jgi:hypothetical protein
MPATLCYIHFDVKQAKTAKNSVFLSAAKMRGGT